MRTSASRLSISRYIEAVARTRPPLLYCSVQSFALMSPPFFGRAARQVVLRKVRSVDRSGGVRAQHGNATLEVPPAEQFCRGKVRRTTTNDDDTFRRGRLRWLRLFLVIACTGRRCSHPYGAECSSTAQSAPSVQSPESVRWPRAMITTVAAPAATDTQKPFSGP